MRVGLISDIHSNHPALEAVLQSMPDNLDALVCAGDIVGYSACQLSVSTEYNRRVI